MIHRYSAAIFLLALWALLLVLHALLEYQVNLEGHETVPWMLAWSRAVIENLQSEVWQIALAAWVFKHFFWKGSPESKEVR